MERTKVIDSHFILRLINNLQSTVLLLEPDATESSLWTAQGRVEDVRSALAQMIRRKRFSNQGKRAAAFKKSPQN